MENHSEKQHFDCLRELCRTCGGRALTHKQKQQKRKPYKCFDHKNDILLSFGVCIASDDMGIHPSNFCHSCFDKTRHIKRHSYAGTIQNARQLVKNSAHLWVPYDRNIRAEDCRVCERYQTTSLDNRNVAKPTTTFQTSAPSVTETLELRTVVCVRDTKPHH
ncbi:hypothetical protein PoB_000448200 [Plakobranchus ocellatus]|uniref:Uncharacterized protein n=1 Tax=Plakobranchus ocellatus TaxID=259542 RepID=A0AAV3Y792_9GAST|nr:hypothetical protein PoB_000448200 [Plakobranchus ocellatus]